MTNQSRAILQIIKSVPEGKISSYGRVARAAGKLVPESPPGARQVARLLHSCTEKYDLPWHRIVGSQGKILMPPGAGKEEQIFLLRSEGVQVSDAGKIPSVYFWEIPPQKRDL